jgi:hypothetical protein
VAAVEAGLVVVLAVVLVEVVREVAGQTVAVGGLRFRPQTLRERCT